MQADLLALADRVEAATGPDRVLFIEIVVALDLRPEWLARQDGQLWVDLSGSNPVLRWANSSIGQSHGNPSVDDPANFLGSLDAAMTLVPEGCQWRVDSHYNIAGVFEYYTDNEVGASMREYAGQASAPPRALTAACLRARASMESGQ